MKAMLISTLLAAGALIAPLTSTALGDNWTRVRGDLSPGLSYNAFVATPSGRWIAAGGGGRLMISDDNGANWRYDTILENGQPLDGNVTDLVLLGNTIVGTATRLIPSSNRFQIPFEGQTKIISSIDNGSSWQVETFPVREAIASVGRFPGIYLTHLFVTPGGGLIAYGTTLLSNGFGGFYIGGLIFRRMGASWQQMYFSLGALQSMAQTGSRLAAAGFQTVLDSADGGGWNGYRLSEAQYNVDGNVLGPDVLEGLNGSDITFLNGNYVMQTQLFRRSESIPELFEAVAVRNFVLESPNPFDGGRNWTGTELSRLYPDWLNVDGQLLSVGGRGAQISSTGADWMVADDTVREGFGSVGAIDNQTVISVGNSDEVWRSDNRGSSWSKILDQDPGPNMSNPFRVGNRILALGQDFRQRVWSSVDNGATWVEFADLQEQTGIAGFTRIRGSGDRLFSAQGNQVITSTDEGKSWAALPYPASPETTGVLIDVVVGQNGRLIIAPEDRTIGPEADFFTSDDNGQTWTQREGVGGFGSTPEFGIHAGGGRIIYLKNASFSFSPELVVSDDNGVTWRVERPFNGLEGLLFSDESPELTTIDLEQIFRTRSGRLIIRGDSGEILTSDDRGDSWVVREYRDLDGVNGGDGVFLGWTIGPIVEAGDRLIAPGSRRTSTSNSNRIPIVWISADDGTTWRTTPIEVENRSSRFFDAVVTPDGRVMLSGGNGSIYLSDPPDTPEISPTVVRVREGEALALEVPRPPLDGAITLTYKVTPGSAQEGADYVAGSGVLSWTANDMAAKPLAIDTVNNMAFEPTEDFLIELGTDGDLIVSFSYQVEILDNTPSASARVDLLIDGPLVTSESGQEDSFRLVLAREPANDVVVSLVVADETEVQALANSFTFTSSNWNTPQTVTLIGQNDDECDLEVAVTLNLAIESEDTAYSDLMPLPIFVTNFDDDQPLFIDGFEAESAGRCGG